ncbi:MAG: hypothetical protein C4583_16010 [Anaerolineaceae bacterium]|nr:MAG: hypothetical protein C4583_16010 [Anaerolineaceae bacterium]
MFAEDGASAHSAPQREQVREGDAVEQHRVGALLLQHQWREDGRQTLRVRFCQCLDDLYPNLRLISQEKNGCADPLPTSPKFSEFWGGEQCLDPRDDGTGLSAFPLVVSDNSYGQSLHCFPHLLRLCTCHNDYRPQPSAQRCFGHLSDERLAFPIQQLFWLSKSF